jgi:hypothetical protein
MNSSYKEWAAGVKQMQPEHKVDAETIQIMLADWTADRAALRGLVRELREALAEKHRFLSANAGTPPHDDCPVCALIARAEVLAGEPGEGGERSSGVEVACVCCDGRGQIRIHPGGPIVCPRCGGSKEEPTVEH